MLTSLKVFAVTGFLASAVTIGSASARVPFGFFNQPVDQMGSVYTAGNLKELDPAKAVALLETIKKRGGHVVMRLVGSSLVHTTNCRFDMDKFKKSVDTIAKHAAKFKSYVTSGTLIASYIIDQPNYYDMPGCPIGFVSGETVEAMAKYHKLKLPGVPTIARVLPSWLADENYSSGSQKGKPVVYTGLDAAWGQYLLRLNDVHTYIDREVDAAKSRKLGLMVSLNVLNGGSVPSGADMSDRQLIDFGKALLDNPYICGLLMWQYDSGYQNRHKSTLATLGGLAAKATGSSCVKN